MQPALLVAALLAMGLGAAHSILGERLILRRLPVRGLVPRTFGSDTFAHGALRATWHLATVAWCGLAAVLAWAGSTQAGAPAPVLWIPAAAFALTGLIIGAASRARHPAWAGFLAVAGLAAWAAQA